MCVGGGGVCVGAPWRGAGSGRTQLYLGPDETRVHAQLQPLSLHEVKPFRPVVPPQAFAPRELADAPHAFVLVLRRHLQLEGEVGPIRVQVDILLQSYQARDPRHVQRPTEFRGYRHVASRVINSLKFQHYFGRF